MCNIDHFESVGLYRIRSKSRIKYLLIIFCIFMIICLNGTVIRGASIDDVPHMTYFLVTVDVETPSPYNMGDFPLPQQINAKIRKEGVGISRMMDIADEYNVLITFFFNVYEYPAFSKDAIKEVVQTISRRGHDVQLHTHPLLIDEKGRPYMYEYGLNEQIDIVKQGRELLREWTGKYPLAHRAGTYAANDNTLLALIENGIFLDSSYRYKYPLCHLREEEFRTNALTQKGLLLEVPVTVFYGDESTSLFGYKLPGHKKLKKFDIDSCDLDLLKIVTTKLYENKMNTITLFMHSWSFVRKWSANPEERVSDTDDINDFREILRFVRNHPGIQPISTSDFWEKWKNGGIVVEKKDFVPETVMSVGLITYARRCLRIHRGNYLYWVAGLVGCGFALAILIFSIRFHKSRKN